MKDRAALAMVEDGERRGLLGAGQVLLDATSGNTGISYAMLGAARGFLVKLCVPANVTRERRQMLQAYGADVVLTDPMDGSDGAIAEARRIYAADPDRYFYPDQYSNDANWRAHFETTGAEILEQTGGRVTHFVAGLGTSGTFVGTGRRLRASGRPIELVSVQPDSPLHGLEGLKHMASAIVPRIYDPSLADRNLTVTTEDAHAMTRRLARDAGLFVGPSSGAALVGVRSRSPARSTAACIVTIFPDGGARYLSEPFWQAPGATLRLPVEDARGDPRARRGDLSRRVLRRAARPARTARSATPGRLDNTTDLERRRRFLDRPRRLSPRRSARGGARPRDRRLLPLAPGSSGGAVRVRPRARVAEPELRDRVGPRRRAARDCGRGGCAPIAPATTKNPSRKETRHAGPHSHSHAACARSRASRRSSPRKAPPSASSCAR